MKTLNVRNISYLLVLLIFILENVFLFFYLNTWKNEKKVNEQAFVDLQNAFVDGNANKIQIVSLLDYLKLDGSFLSDIQITKVYIQEKSNSVRNKISLYSVLKKNDLLLRFSQYCCSSCITGQLEQLQKLEKTIGRDNVVLFTDTLTKQMREYLLNKNVTYRVFELGDGLLTEYDDQFIPYVCVVNQDHQITSSMPVSKEILNYTKYFYEAYEKTYCTK